MMLSLNSIIILGVMLLAAIWQLAYGLRPMWVTGHRPEGESALPTEPEEAVTEPEEAATESEETVTEPEETITESEESVTEPEAPAGRSVTVVVFASCDETILNEWIDMVLDQDYSNFDVVVVYDANAEMTAGLAERYSNEKRLYFTFIPPGSHTLNRRKLALTIGIKAAKGEYILTTLPQVKIPSRRWLSQMMEPVNNSLQTEVVLGFSHFDFSRFGFPARLRTRVNTVTEGARWIGDAILGRPWRGDGNNLIFKRSLFFENKGFADGMLLEGGDDDIFVGRIAREDNTAVCVTSATVLTVDWGVATGRVQALVNKRYRSTRSRLPQQPRMARNACRIIGIAMILLGVLASWLSCFHWTADLAAGVICLIFYGLDYAAYRRASYRLLPVT